jgi:hypothetical protein
MHPRLKSRRGRFGPGGLTGPTLTIDGPGGILSFGPGSPLTIGNFTGASSDDLDGDLSANIQWRVHGPGSPTGTLGSPAVATGASVDLSGSLAVAGSPQFAPSAFGVVGSVSDSGGSTATRTLTITVNTRTDYPPVLSITSPASGSVFGPGSPGSVPNFVGSAVDNEDGDISASIEWFVHGFGSPLPTTFGSPVVATGASVNLIAALPNVGSPPGSPAPLVGSPAVRDYTVVARITDSGGNKQTDSVTIRVTQ